MFSTTDQSPKRVSQTAPTPSSPDQISPAANLSLKTQTSTTNQKFLPDFSVTNETFLTRDENFANFTFNLASGTIHLKVESNDHGSSTRLLYGSDVDGVSPASSFTRIQFKGLNSLMSCKFRSQTFVYILELEEFTVFDDHTKNSIYPKLVYKLPSKSQVRLTQKESLAPVLYFSFERIGLFQRIYCETAPLTIIHNPELGCFKSIFK